MKWRTGALALILLSATCTTPVSGQLVGKRSVDATNCASAVGGDVRDSTITTVCGMPPEQVVELVRLAASPQAGDRAELLVRISALVPASSELRVKAIVKFFRLLGEVPVEDNQLADRFAQIADQQREEAGLVFEQARVERARLAYDEAARLFKEATDLLPAGDVEARWRYTLNEGHAWSAKGDHFADSHALEQAVTIDRAALQLASRSERPLDWAATQKELGITLRLLGQREGGTAHLQESVTSFRLALEEVTRERSLLQWGHPEETRWRAQDAWGTRD